MQTSESLKPTSNWTFFLIFFAILALCFYGAKQGSAYYANSFTVLVWLHLGCKALVASRFDSFYVNPRTAGYQLAYWSAELAIIGALVEIEVYFQALATVIGFVIYELARDRACKEQ